MCVSSFHLKLNSSEQAAARRKACYQYPGDILTLETIFSLPHSQFQLAEEQLHPVPHSMAEVTKHTAAVLGPQPIRLLHHVATAKVLPSIRATGFPSL